MPDTIIIKDGHVDCKDMGCKSCPIHNLSVEGLRADDYFSSDYTDEVFYETGDELCSQMVVYAKFFDHKNWSVRNINKKRIMK